MMFRRLSCLVVLLGLAALPACSGMGDEDSLKGGCAGNWASVALRVTPSRVTRGAAVDIAISWEVVEVLSEPVMASLLAADETIEVEVPLRRDADGPEPLVYFGVQLNPFGVGAPPGAVSVLAQATPVDTCWAPATATASFLLE